MLYLLLIIVTLGLGLGTQALINAQYKKWDKVYSHSGLTGAEAARRMLDSHGLYDVPISITTGRLSDNFDPRKNCLNLSQSVYGSYSVASIAIACHEAGHAVQHNLGYTPIKVRTAIFPVVNFASNAWIVVLLIGIAMNLMDMVWVAVGLYALVVLFQLVTLPVELNASNRAMTYISDSLAMSAEQDKGARSVLTAAALTYVAAALASLLQLLYLVARAEN